MAGTGIMAEIYLSPSPSSYPIEKIRNSPYPYPVNAGIFRQNGNGFGQYSRERGQYSRERVYLSSLPPGCNNSVRIYLLYFQNIWN